MDVVIQTVNLNKKFDREILKNINFTLKKGQTLGLTGKNGAGKTTLIKIILGFLQPTSGVIKVFGRKPAQAAGLIGYLPEKPDYHLLFSGREYLTHLARISGVGRAEERVRDILALVGMGKYGTQRMSRYSKGMLQRIGLAQAILLDPPLLILDEPLSGLDPGGQKELRDIVRELGQRGKTILLCSHMLGEIEKVCTEIALIHCGNLIRHGNINDTLEYRDRYQLKVEGLSKTLLQSLGTVFSVKPVDEENIILDEKFKGEKEKFLGELIKHGVFIRELKPFRMSLEDLFISSTGEQ